MEDEGGMEGMEGGMEGWKKGWVDNMMFQALCCPALV